MTKKREESPLRIIPDSWTDPLHVSHYFPNPERSLTVDVGSGKARFLLERSSKESEINFLGMDRMLKRIRKTAKKAERRGLENVRLLRLDAYYTVTYLIPEQSVDRYYILFPDPWPKAKHHHHRLMNPAFIQALVRTLKPGGEFHFATDHAPYFKEAMEFILQEPRFERVDTWMPIETEVTDFELMFRDTKPIGRASFRLI